MLHIFTGQYGSHKPIMSIEHLTCGYHKWDTGFLIHLDFI